MCPPLAWMKGKSLFLREALAAALEFLQFSNLAAGRGFSETGRVLEPHGSQHVSLLLRSTAPSSPGLGSLIAEKQALPLHPRQRVTPQRGTRRRGNSFTMSHESSQR